MLGAAGSVNVSEAKVRLIGEEVIQDLEANIHYFDANPVAGQDCDRE
jgi:hypothetical protein